MRSEKDIHKVTRVEYHHLPTCPCIECVKERKRREPLINNHIKKLSVKAAYHLGFLRRRSPQGSVARELMNK